MKFNEHQTRMIDQTLAVPLMGFGLEKFKNKMFN